MNLRRSAMPALAAVMMTILAACSSGAESTTTASVPGVEPASTPTSSTSSSSGAPDGAGTVWLCQPGTSGDPCAGDLDSTTVSPTADLTVVPWPAASGAQPVDCFYVYPTVSTQTTPNSDLTVEPSEIKAARAQASRFSSVCNVWAPMYRQETQTPTPASQADEQAAPQIAYDSLAAAWHDYLDHFNDGRPIVLLSHSQGSSIVIQLLRREVDDDDAMRGRLVSAVILGGNVEVPVGGDVGVTFQHLPACRSNTQTGCVIAYSSFPSEPPTNAFFGITGQGIDAEVNAAGQADTDDRAGIEVLCTNPASLAAPATAGALDPYFWIADRPSRQFLTTDWVGFPALYTATCHHEGNASWLQVDDVGAATDTRTRLPTDGAQWGFHSADVNVALGNLVADVGAQIAAYLAAHPA